MITEVKINIPGPFLSFLLSLFLLFFFSHLKLRALSLVKQQRTLDNVNALMI